MDSSPEAIERLLDDYDLTGFLSAARDQHWLPKGQLAALRAFQAALGNYVASDDDRTSDAARLTTPK